VNPAHTRVDVHDDLRNEVRELITQWRAESGGEPVNDAWMRSFDPEFSRRLADGHLIGISWPKDVGGGGQSYRVRLAVAEELLRAGAPVNAHWLGERQVGPAIFRTGSQQLQDELLPGMLKGEIVFCVCMSEPEAGSDLAAVRTTAQDVEGGWLLNGTKIWTTNAHRATHAYILARTDPNAPKHAGLSEFIVDMDAPGISVSRILDMSGGHHFNEVSFQDVFVPTGRLLGEVGCGWRQVTEQLSFERSGPERVLSSYPLLGALIDSIDHADAGIEAELGELTSRLAFLRHLCRHITEALDHGAAPVQEAATLKYLGTQFERDVLDVARRAGTPAAELQDSYDQALMASPAFTIRGGALEVLLGLIAKKEAGS
jgi:alkylation response protein AidB-like acyl-CoA dehydrogenase